MSSYLSTDKTTKIGVAYTALSSFSKVL